MNATGSNLHMQRGIPVLGAIVATIAATIAPRVHYVVLVEALKSIAIE